MHISTDQRGSQALEDKDKKLKEKDAVIQRKDQELQKLRIKIDDFRKQHEELKEQRSEIEDMCSSYQKASDNATRRTLEIEKAYTAELQTARDELRKIEELLQADTEAKKEACAQVISTDERRIDELDQIQAQMKTCQERLGLERRIRDGLEAQLESKSPEMADVKARLEIERQAKEELDVKFEEATEEIEKLRRLMIQYEEDLETGSKTLDQLSSKFKSAMERRQELSKAPERVDTITSSPIAATNFEPSVFPVADLPSTTDLPATLQAATSRPTSLSPLPVSHTSPQQVSLASSQLRRSRAPSATTKQPKAKRPRTSGTRPIEFIPRPVEELIQGRHCSNLGEDEMDTCERVAFASLPESTRTWVKIYIDSLKPDFPWYKSPKGVHTCVRARLYKSKGTAALDKFDGENVACKECTIQGVPCLRYFHNELYLVPQHPKVRNLAGLEEVNFWQPPVGATDLLDGLGAAMWADAHDTDHFKSRYGEHRTPQLN